MSVSKWSYNPEKCDGDFCVGNCDFCTKCDIAMENDEEYKDCCHKNDTN